MCVYNLEKLILSIWENSPEKIASELNAANQLTIYAFQVQN